MHCPFSAPHSSLPHLSPSLLPTLFTRTLLGWEKWGYDLQQVDVLSRALTGSFTSYKFLQQMPAGHSTIKNDKEHLHSNQGRPRQDPATLHQFPWGPLCWYPHDHREQEVERQIFERTEISLFGKKFKSSIWMNICLKEKKEKKRHWANLTQTI